MPVTYDLDPSAAFIRTRCVGAITLPEVIKHFQELASNPSLPESLDVLLDLSECETFPEPDQVATISNEIGHMQEKRLNWGSFAIVADRDVLFGMCRMLQTLSAGYFAQSSVFKTHDEAEQWLKSIRS